MTSRGHAARPADSDPLTAAHIAAREEDSTTVNLPPLRTRSVVVPHSLQAQWRGTAGRSHNSAAYVSDSQRTWLFLGLLLIAGLLIVATLHFSEPHEPHPAAQLHPEHPVMLKRAAAMAQAQVAASLSSVAAAGGSVGPSAIASPFSIVFVTVPTADVASKLASGLLEKKLVACANIVPGVTSMYWWEGKIQNEQEQLMMLKTRSSLFQQVREYVQQNHPYNVPEVIELPIQQAHTPYLDWIRDSTKDPSA